MIIKHNIRIYDISWLKCSYAKGIVGTYYEPETIDELKELCTTLYKENKHFDIVGHTSNIYFMPDYNVEVMVSTRKCNKYNIEDNYIVCECGASVKKLSREMIHNGIRGFEGLLDLPGTVAAAVYGNASCFDCSINNLLLDFEILINDGSVKSLTVEDLKLSTRSTILKEKKLLGVILTVRLRKDYDDVSKLLAISERNHQIRMATQPGPQNNIGSIYRNSNELNFIPKILIKVFSKIFRQNILNTRKKTVLSLLGGRKLIPYVYGWNRYIWKDDKSHEKFWKFHRIHSHLFKDNTFEIEIKKNK